MAETTPKSDQEITFTGVHVQNAERIFVPAVVDEYSEEKRDHAMLFSRVRDKWYIKLLDDSLGGVCAVVETKNVTLAMAVNGTVYALSSSGVATEQIDPSPDGPNYVLLLRGIRKIGGHVYAVGMARMVYRRNAPGAWQRIDAGTFVPKKQRTKAVGFNDVHGSTETAIYAVGYKGEIWFFDGTNWEQQESPTNVVLTGVQCVGDEVFVCGLAGTLLRGTRGRWEQIDQTATSADFWDITVFKESIYVSNYDGVFVLNKNGLDRVNMRLPAPITTAYIDAADGLMWSVGQKDLAYTSDGTTWIQPDMP